MAELADAQDLGSCGKLRAGSIPVNRTTKRTVFDKKTVLFLTFFAAKVFEGFVAGEYLGNTGSWIVSGTRQFTRILVCIQDQAFIKKTFQSKPLVN